MRIAIAFCMFLFQLVGLSTSSGQVLDAENLGFSVDSTGISNAHALQEALDEGGTIRVSKPGVYKIAKTIYIGSNTTLEFGNGVVLKKVDENGLFTHVLLNKGAPQKKYDENIVISGLSIMVNGVDKRIGDEMYGLRGQLAFHYVKDLKIERFRCEDLETKQFGIHICNFEDIIIEDVVIGGKKDGIHLGVGKRFRISGGVFQTVDDAIALNGHDYATSNPEVGWIEDGIIENCYDLADSGKPIGFFCRILAGGWTDWKQGMGVRFSDAVISNGRLYRVVGEPDGLVRISKTQPIHKEGTILLDDILWKCSQNEEIYTAGVRNVVFRNIMLEKPRTSFSFHFDNGTYSRSYYPGAEIPQQEQFLFEGIKVKHDGELPLVKVNTPVDTFTIKNSSLRNSGIFFQGISDLSNYGKTQINFYGNFIKNKGVMLILENQVPQKEIFLNINQNLGDSDKLSITVKRGSGKLTVDSDINVLYK
tara:strand:+ start:1053 stop:2483 length:1431 start_codon:yes stop_codon:yes gene_type:complete